MLDTWFYEESHAHTVDKEWFKLWQTQVLIMFNPAQNSIKYNILVFHIQAVPLQYCL